ncbi:MotA/TolQ/ExbB proton channel family protein [Alteromonas sp. 5E99-2]|uniref:MotA/TolQ/ExbB proton channel family protein n=1 Tax=Alteromonas sp. 5E99-2 TaxID=2817683 RepID=UPI001A982204|nr:MotA/TolQ/ExbB proton channel family protein [Alteromonas sp. 5E99-2]MBO1256291.1 MotA/TolQ/ExbB proton channel family protein [Alteromonas sp. 5E99-2]
MKLSMGSEQICPPKLAEKFVKWSVPNELEEPLLGDLAEEYLELLSTHPQKANFWYTRQALYTGLQFLTQTKSELIMFIFGILVFFGVVVLSMWGAGSIGIFSNIPSLLIVIPPAVLITMAASTKQTRKDAIQLLFNEQIPVEKVNMLQAKQVYTTLGNMSMLMGWIGIVIGAIGMSNNITVEGFSHVFGPSLAVCLLTLYYGLVIKGLCYAAEAKIQAKILAP